MMIQLGNCFDEKNKLNKNFSIGLNLSGELKEHSSIINPEILIECDNPSNYNYLYIPEFTRYYYITDIISIRNNIWRIIAHVDVLNSFKNDIANVPIILSDTENVLADSYLPSDIWKTTVKSKTDIVNFSDGLNDDGEYILITSGGL